MFREEPPKCMAFKPIEGSSSSFPSMNLNQALPDPVKILSFLTEVAESAAKTTTEAASATSEVVCDAVCAVGNGLTAAAEGAAEGVGAVLEAAADIASSALD